MSDEGRVREWTEISGDALDESAIRQLYAGRGPHRVSCNRYPAGAAFRAIAKGGACYVLAGSCRYEFNGSSIELRSGQFTELPAGEYRFEVLGAQPVLLARAWKLPDSFVG